MGYTLGEQQCRNLEVSVRREWLLTNGIGGYAMGTASGINSRRYHAHLVAATDPPTGRKVLLAAVDATVQAGGNPLGISANQYPGAVFPEGYHYLKSFSVGRSAIWRYRASGLELEKRLTLHPRENAATVRYRNTGPAAFTLALRPLVGHRDHHGNLVETAGYPADLAFQPGATVVTDGVTPLVLSHPGARMTPIHGWYYRFEHFREVERGLDPRDDLFCPCELVYVLRPGEEAVLVAADREGVEPLLDEEEPSSEFRVGAQLREAAEKFLVHGRHRTSILAGYPWFTDWGRDTMISLPGVCLHTGRPDVARHILADYASQLDHGLIPNRFVEVGERPDYNTVDATLWFANAVHRTLAVEWDASFARKMQEALREVLERHRKGTLFGIGIDPEDGLLRQGEPGVQLTWMDAKVGDWVVTPRHGKPVEINGLWHNLLCVLADLDERLGAPKRAESLRKEATRVRESFHAKFWHEIRGHFLDTVDPADATLRPNQVLALALPFPPIDESNPEHLRRARQALSVVSRELLTPVGLRTLGPQEPNYRPKFEGSMPERDAAYHQGTVWPWLLGSYVTALVRYTGDRAEAKRLLRNAKAMLTEYGLGGIAEVYDADAPQGPGGCPWQAWSVAEILRSWVEDVGGD